MFINLMLISTKHNITLTKFYMNLTNMVNASIVNCVIICVYGIAYKTLNTLFQIYSMTVAKLPLDENNFELF